MPLAMRAGGARRDDQLARAIAVQHDALVALEHVAGAGLARHGGDVVQIVARLPLGMREGQAQGAVGDGGDQCRALLRRAAQADQIAAQDDRRHERLQRQAAADGFHDDHGFHRAAAEPAIFLAERQREQPEFGVFGPQRVAVAVRLCLGAAAQAQIVVGRPDEAVDAVLQQALFVAELEVHEDAS